MDLYLQLGYGMMGLANELLNLWKTGGVVLSPRDLDHSQLERVAVAARAASVEVLLDPQCYLHAADHHRLTSYEYWKEFGPNQTADLISTGNIGSLRILREMNERLGCGAFILPGIYAESVDDLWWEFHESQMRAALDLGLEAAYLQPTVALSANVVSDEAAIDEVIDRVKSWHARRIYVVLETTSSYLTESPLWLAGAFQLAAGLKLNGKSLLFGYANHQMLPLAAIGVDAMASGSWLNVRAFQPERFMTSEDDDVSRRAKGGWYYCPQAFSEYKMPTLDVALRVGALGSMYPDPDSGFAGPLFSGVQPTLVDWGERNSFLHYLNSIRSQCLSVRRSSYQESMEVVQRMLEAGRVLVSRLRSNGVRGNDRDFHDYFDVSLSAMALLESAYGARLRRWWP